MSIRRQILFTIAGLVIGISGTVLFVEMGFRVVNFFNPFMDKYNLTGIVHPPIEILDVYFKELDRIYPGISTVKNRKHSDILE